MATYAAFKHIELSKLGTSKKRFIFYTIYFIITYQVLKKLLHKLIRKRN